MQEFFVTIAVMGHGGVVRFQEAQGLLVEYPHGQRVALEQQPELEVPLL